MKNLKKVAWLTVGLFATAASAQDLQIPSTPAFSILGYEPASVMRPASTKKLSSDLLNSFDQDGNLLMNLGMEVAPYWLKSRPGLTRKQYLEPTPMQSFLQTLSFSAATVKDTVTGMNNLGAGFRFQLFRGELTNEFAEREAELKTLETAISAIAFTRSQAGASITTLNAAIDRILADLKTAGIPQKTIDGIEARATAIAMKYIDPATTKYRNDTASIKSFCQDLTDSFEEQTNELAKEVIELSNKRTGFSLEVAGAAKFITTTGSQAFNKAGFWVNANNYFTQTDAWTITARLMANTGDTLSVNTDVGFGYIKEGKNFNVSIEGMLRWYRTEMPDFNGAGEPVTILEKDFTYRVAAQISYSIAENASINVSAGKDFDDANISGTGLFSILGLNYTIFNRQKAIDDRTLH